MSSTGVDAVRVTPPPVVAAKGGSAQCVGPFGPATGGGVTMRSFRRPGKLIPPHAVHFKGRSMMLKPGQAVAWHTTGAREELLLILEGTVRLELTSRAIALAAGRCAFLPRRVRHRVVNRSARPAHYLYVTAR